MKKNKIFKRCFALFIVALLLSVFSLSSFAFDNYNPYPGNVGFDQSNTYGSDQYLPIDYYTEDGYGVVTSSGTPIVTYYMQDESICLRFSEGLELKEGREYYIIWFVVSAQQNFDATKFNVFDGELLFDRNGNSVQHGLNKVHYMKLNGELCPAYFNSFYVPVGEGNKTIYSLACDYYDVIEAPIIFVPFIYEHFINECSDVRGCDHSEHLDQYNGCGFHSYWDGIVFGNGNYTLGTSFYSALQIVHLSTLKNSSFYSYERGHKDGFAKGFANKQQYGDQMREAGFQDGILFQKSQYTTELKNEYDRGWDVGYDVGKSDGLNSQGLGLTFKGLFFSVLDAPFDVIRGALNFEFLGINLASFFFSLITLSCFAVLYKRFKG